MPRVWRLLPVAGAWELLLRMSFQWPRGCRDHVPVPQGWRNFFLSTAAPGNGGPLRAPRGQTSVFYKCVPPFPKLLLFVQTHVPKLPMHSKFPTGPWCRVPPAPSNGSEKVEGSMSSGVVPESDVNNNGTQEAVSGSKGSR